MSPTRRTRLLMNIQNQGWGLNPSLAGRPEGSPSPPQAGTGCKPRRQRGRGNPGRPPPASQLGLDSPAPDVAPPPSHEPRVTQPGARGVQRLGPGRPEFLHRILRDPEVQAPALRLQNLSHPGAQRPLLEQPGARTSPRGTLEAERPVFPVSRTQDPGPQTPSRAPIPRPRVGGT